MNQAVQCIQFKKGKLVNNTHFSSGINHRADHKPAKEVVLQQLVTALGVENVSADSKQNAHFRKGWRSGEGAALAVIFPQDLSQLWETLKICVAADTIIIMQAANTGLTEGSTPSGNDYDREVVVINTLSIAGLFLGDENRQVVCLPGTTLHQLEKKLKAVNRKPHSVIGSSNLGATVLGGVANNSGGALVKRGPAYTELSLFAQINQHGELVLVNHLDVDLGDTPEQIFENLSTGKFDITASNKMASDRQYVDRIRDVDAETPSRFNTDKRRLYESSGCAGKLAVFAVRLDTFSPAKREQTFYIGTNDYAQLTTLRRQILSKFDSVPEVGEYLHRDMFDISEKYGKDTFLSILHLGSDSLPKLFSLKGKLDNALNSVPFIPTSMTDKLMQCSSALFPSHLPNRLKAYRDKYEHHLILKMSDDGIDEAGIFLQQFFSEASTGSYFVCDEDETKKAFLHRFAAAGAAIRYQTMHQKEVGELLALDIALPRNCEDWVERLPPEIDQDIEKKLYYGHFFCFVFHQDYILKKGVSAKKVKAKLLALLTSKGAKYPAEHNVGHLYEAESDLRRFYQSLDPTNSFNPGIGFMQKTKRNCACCL